MWINNRLDLNDMWGLVTKREKIILWCVENGENDRAGNKRSRDDSGLQEEENEPPSKRMSRIGTQKAQAKEYEMDLKKKHEGTYTPFQYKLWAEMMANGSHDSLHEPPAVAMFNREIKQSKGSNVQTDLMVTVIDKLCTALTPKPEKGKGSLSSSPMKRAELRSTYIKQLNELKMLYKNGILTEIEYNEQREELVKLMRQLKK